MSYARVQNDPAATAASADPQDALLAVPQDKSTRQTITVLARDFVDQTRVELPLGSSKLEKLADKLLKDSPQFAQYRGFAMIMLANAANRRAFSQVPVKRRMLMLPRCLAKQVELATLRQQAQQMGYHVIIADGTPAVLKVLATGAIDAILGVACSDSLRRIFETVRQLSAPSMAVPLLRAGCINTQVDIELLSEYLHLSGDGDTAAPTSGYLAILQQCAKMFDQPALDELINAAFERSENSPGAHTHRVAIDWLATGGKRLRPFITLAAYCARSGRDAHKIPRQAKAAAIAIEAFHKASLAHDDIEDDDSLRYGSPTLHVKYGIGHAINIGDYLLGLGYCLSNWAAGPAGTNSSAILADAHARLALGQGQELLWRQSDGKKLTPSRQEILRCYALKTSPAFEAALRMGLLLGGGIDSETDRQITLFCRHIGVGFQLLNDINDWDRDKSADRITYPLALVADGIKPDKARLQTYKLIAALKQRSDSCSEAINPPAAGQLCKFLSAVVLDNTGDI